METPHNQEYLDESDMSFYHQRLEELESYLLDPYDDADPSISCDGGIQQKQFPDQPYPFHNSSPSVSFSSHGSSNAQADGSSDINTPVYDNCISAVSVPYSVEYVNVETGRSTTLDFTNVGPHTRFPVESELLKQVKERGHKSDLKTMLVACAKAISDGDALACEWLMSELRLMVSVSGEPLQRLGAYMLEGLVARLASSGSIIYKALKCKEPTSTELLSYMHMLYEVCPYFKFGYLSANGAIAEAMKNENRIHIIDFQIAQGGQWITLIQALAGRPGGPPRIRITGIDDSVSSYARGGGLEIVGKRLSKLAESFGVPLEFHGVSISSCDIESKHLNIQQGEGLAVNFALTLHHVPDERVGFQNHRDRILRMVKSLSPKVVTLVEQESDTNTPPFFARFVETLDYYNSVFESIDVALPRDNKERISVEQHCLARDIVNIIACEGTERVERHELLGKWRQRFTMAGFTPFPLSSFVNTTIKTVLENYSGNYRLQEKDGCLYLGWMDRPLVVSCAWI